MVSLAPDAPVSQGVDYVRAYIKAALSGEDGLSAPDKTLAQGQFETLISLYQAFQLDGMGGAKKAWETIKKFRPALAGLDPDPQVLTFKPDDDMIATELGKELREEAAYFHSQWKVYEDGCWRGQDDSEFRRYIRRELRHWRGRGIAVTQTRIKALASMLADDLFIKDKLIMECQYEQTHYINLRNGLFNLDTMSLEPHRADLYFTTQLDFDYDPHATVDHFIRYLNSSLVFADGSTDRTLVDLVLEALAYSMTARTDMKASFWLYGGKDTGKSTFITLLKTLLGDLYATLDLNQLGDNKFILAGMIGKRVVAFSEGDSNKVLDDGLYKNLTGGSDEVWADVKNKPGITFRPEAKIWWAMNNMPRINDRSGATTRRIIIIPFNRTIPESQRILDLEHKLRRERSGIFNLVMDHLIDLTKRGSFIFCKQSEQMRQEYIMENDTEATFIEECADRHESYRVQGKELNSRYFLWCEENGFKSKNANQIGKEWKRLGFEKIKSNTTVWLGLKLKTF